ncbi:MAG: penicillin-insensitive murein endopeptidase [Pseudomonadota bacterium]
MHIFQDVQTTCRPFFQKELRVGKDTDILRAQSKRLSAFGLHVASAVTRASLSLLIIATGLQDIASAAEAAKPAKELFGAITLPTKGTAVPYGFYAKGCMAGAVAIPADGPTWQAMRLSRNRRWGNPAMITLIERLSREAAEKDGWPGLLLGDIAQPRGGPMLTGHASHQIGLDADIWLTPMPDRRLSKDERENLAATSMLKKNAFLTVDPSIWSESRARLIMRAASYPDVERIFVNPAIKKKLCETWTGDRRALGKVRPYYGHDYHFHIRMHCPKGSTTCKAQEPVAAGDGCDASLAWWYKPERWADPKDKPKEKPAKPSFLKMSDLPSQCVLVLNSPPDVSTGATQNPDMMDAETNAVAPTSAKALTTGAPSETMDAYVPLSGSVPVPLPRP